MSFRCTCAEAGAVEPCRAVNHRPAPDRMVGGDRKDPGPLTFGAHVMEEAPGTDTAAAKKMDMGKVPVWQGFLNYFPRAIIAVALVSEYGKRKYAPDAEEFNSGWRDVPNGINRYLDADARHMLKRAIPSQGEYDDESELAHLAHKAWNAMAELETALIKGTVQCRVGVVILNGKPQPGTSKVVTL